jgi:hypothetical protein
MMASSQRLALILALLALLGACRDEQHSHDHAATSATATLPTLALSAAPAPQAAPTPTAPGAAVAEEKRPTTPLYVRLPGAIPPLERSDKFESPLDALLRERKLGQVSGGGSGLKPGGGIGYAGLDVDVYDAKVAIPVVIQQLRELKAPQGTTVEELRDDGPAIQHRVW